MSISTVRKQVEEEVELRQTAIQARGSMNVGNATGKYKPLGLAMNDPKFATQQNDYSLKGQVAQARDEKNSTKVAFILANFATSSKPSDRIEFANYCKELAQKGQREDLKRADLRNMTSDQFQALVPMASFNRNTVMPRNLGELSKAEHVEVDMPGVSLRNVVLSSQITGNFENTKIQDATVTAGFAYGGSTPRVTSLKLVHANLVTADETQYKDHVISATADSTITTPHGVYMPQSAELAPPESKEAGTPRMQPDLALLNAARHLDAVHAEASNDHVFEVAHRPSVAATYQRLGVSLYHSPRPC